MCTCLLIAMFVLLALVVGRACRFWGCGHGWHHHCGGWRGGHGPWHGHGHGGGGRWRRGEWGGPYGRGHRRWPGFWRPVDFLLAAIDATPEQEKAIRQEAERVKAKLRDLRSERGQTHADLARVIAGDSFDEEALAALFVRHDDLLRGLREEIGGALGRVHTVLDDEQRRRLADLIERGPGRWKGGGGPYRM